LFFKGVTDEYREDFLEKLCGGAAATHSVAVRAEDLNQFVVRLDSLNEKAQIEGFEESVLFSILSYSPDDDLEEDLEETA